MIQKTVFSSCLYVNYWSHLKVIYVSNMPGGNDFDVTFAALIAGAVFKFAAFTILAKKQKRERILVGQLSRITLFPVKSARGIDLEEARCEYTGLVTDDGIRDRAFMVTTDAYNFVTARQEPALTTIKTSVHGDRIHLDAPGMDTVSMAANMSREGLQVLPIKVHGEFTEGVDCGDEVGAWISRYLGKNGWRIVYHAEDLAMRSCINGPSSYHKNSKPQDAVAYQDGFPFVLMTEASVAELNERLEDKVSINNFRPNLVADGCAPFNEDTWQELFVGDTVTFTNIKPCGRCILTTVNPETGKKHANKEPLKTLRSYRCLQEELGKAPSFGINLVVNHPGVIKVGDPIYATVST